MISEVEFRAWARSHGVLIPSAPVRGKMARCPTEHRPRKRNGAYLLLDDRAGCIAHDGDGRWHWFRASGGQTVAQSSRDALQRRADDAALRAAQAQAAALFCQQIVASCTLREHGYLRGKGFTSMRGLVLSQSVEWVPPKAQDDGDVRQRIPEGALIVPMWRIDSAARTPMTLQFIAQDGGGWQKKFLARIPAQGCVHMFGNLSAPTIYLVEGYATGLSVAQAARRSGGACVVVAFSAGSLVDVASNAWFRLATRRSRVVVVADNDASGTGAKAAKATGLPWVMPRTVGMDANDLHQAEGLTAVVRLLSETGVARQA